MYEMVTAIVRDGLEAGVIIGALMGLVSKVGHPEKKQQLIFGALAGLLSVLLLLQITRYSILSQEKFLRPLQDFEGLTMIVSGLLILTTLIVLENKLKTLRATFVSRIEAALEKNNNFLIFLIAFLVTANEGLEVSLISARSLLSERVGTVAVGLTLGLLVVFSLTFLLIRTTLRSKLPRLLRFLNLLLFFSSLSLVNHGLQELAETGSLVTFGYNLPLKGILAGIYKLFLGLEDKVSVTQVLVLLLYSFIFWEFFRRKTQKPQI